MHLLVLVQGALKGLAAPCVWANSNQRHLLVLTGSGTSTPNFHPRQDSRVQRRVGPCRPCDMLALFLAHVVFLIAMWSPLALRMHGWAPPAVVQTACWFNCASHSPHACPSAHESSGKHRLDTFRATRVLIQLTMELCDSDCLAFCTFVLHRGVESESWLCKKDTGPLLGYWLLMAGVCIQ